MKSKTRPENIEVQERRRLALEYRKAGLTYEEVGLQVSKRCGNAAYGKAQAYRDVRDALEGLTREPAEEVLATELARLDGMLSGIWNAARSGDVQAVSSVLRIMDRRARYLGLDTPLRLEGDAVKVTLVGAAEIVDALKAAEELFGEEIAGGRSSSVST